MIRHRGWWQLTRFGHWCAGVFTGVAIGLNWPRMDDHGRHWQMLICVIIAGLATLLEWYSERRAGIE